MDFVLPTLAVAYGADLLVGDPRWFPHPVRGMGWAIHAGERILRRMIPWERVAGALLVIVIVGMSWTGTWWLLRVVTVRSIWWGFGLGVALCFSCLSTRDLAVESRPVLLALDAEDLLLARQRVSRIAGRDTSHLSRSEIVRATVETIAESTVDGILSPMFWFVVGGVPLAVAYKAVNTLDSMIGHRSSRYLKFGWAAARLDAWANWIPARWSAIAFVIGAWMCGGHARASWRCAWRDGCHGPSPNAGIPEAAMAGALGIRLGGENRYEGAVSRTPFLGDGDHLLEPQRIPEAIRLMYVASVTGWVMAMGALLLRLAW